MSCIITYKGKKYSEEQFKEHFINNKQEFTTSIAKNKDVIDSFKRKMEGIDFIFSQSPELASIGSKAQYLQYLSTIFKTSKVKDIVYHGGKTNKDSFKRFVDKTKYKDRNPNSILGFFFSSSKNTVAGQYAEKDYDAIKEHLTGDAETDAFIRRSAPLKKGSVSEELLNIKNPYIIQAEEWENETWVDKLNILTEKDKDDDWVSDYKWTVDAYEKVKNHLQSLGYDGLYINSNKELFNKTGIVDYITVQKVVFETEQIHILSSKADIQGFKEFVQGKQYQKLTAEEKAKTIEQVTKEHRSITALKDLAAKLAWRIGGKVEFVNKTDVDWKAYNQGMTSVLNEAYMTPDTPFHEILAHPIIRAIKNGNKFQIEENLTEKDADKIIEKNQIIEKNGIRYLAAYDAPDGTVIYRYDKTIQTKPNIQLYQNLLKELEYGKGKEVLDRIKRDYKYKKEQYKTGKILLDDLDFDGEGNPQPSYSEEVLEKDGAKYTLEEQQEEAIVTLLGLMAADKLDAKKDATLISKLKELWKQISDLVKSLLKQDGIKIDELPITTTLNDLAEIMGYGNNKIVLPGYAIRYYTPLNTGNKVDENGKKYYDTLEEVNQEIRGLADVNVEIDLSGVKLDFNKNNNPYNLVPDKPYYTSDSNFLVFVNSDKINHYRDFPEYKNLEKGNYYEYKFIPSKYTIEFVKVTTARVQQLVDNNPGLYIGASDELKGADLDKIGIRNFIEKNKEYEQVKEIIKQWKKENNIQYNPEEAYSRGQEFIHVHNAYGSTDTRTWLQNLIPNLEDINKAKGVMEMSFLTYYQGKLPNHVTRNLNEKAVIKIIAYPKSKDIAFASKIDNYTSSYSRELEGLQYFIDLSKVSKREQLAVSYTKSINLSNINTIEPNIADTIDDVAHHNEYAINIADGNFRIEYGEETSYDIKKLIDSINSILDQKYGKLVKPDTSKKILKSEKVYEVRWKNSGGVIIRTTDLNKAKAEMQGDYTDAEGNKLKPEDVVEIVEGSPIEQIGIQPTQTKETLKESIESVKSKFVNPKLNDWRIIPGPGGKDMNWAVEHMLDNNVDIEFFDTEQEARDFIKSLQNKKVEEKEYTQQALTNLKVAALKEVARKYPRSLITSKVVTINPNMVDNSEIQYSKIGSKQDVEGFKEFVNSQTQLQQPSKLTEEGKSLFNSTFNKVDNNKSIVYANYLADGEIALKNILDTISRLHIYENYRSENRLKELSKKQSPKKTLQIEIQRYLDQGLSIEDIYNKKVKEVKDKIKSLKDTLDLLKENKSSKGYIFASLLLGNSAENEAKNLIEYYNHLLEQFLKGGVELFENLIEEKEYSIYGDISEEIIDLLEQEKLSDLSKYYRNLLNKQIKEIKENFFIGELSKKGNPTDRNIFNNLTDSFIENFILEGQESITVQILKDLSNETSINHKSQNLTRELERRLDILKNKKNGHYLMTILNLKEYNEKLKALPVNLKENVSKIEQIKNEIYKTLPKEIADQIIILEDVPKEILGNENIFYSIKNILNDNGIRDEILINWMGIRNNSLKIHPSSIKTENQIEEIIKRSLKNKQKVENYNEFKTNSLALESFHKWNKALESFPLAFQEVMLTHALKWMNNPDRESKYVLQLSSVALQNAYGIVMNKPHELNRIGKLYDSEVLKTVSDAVGHEPSASGKGYWVHIPRTKGSLIDFNHILRDNTNDPNAPAKFTVEYITEIDQTNEIEFFETREAAEKFVEELGGGFDNSAQFKANVELLKKLSPSTWCTSSGMASHYVENYDNYLLIVDGITVAGIEAGNVGSNGKIQVKEVTSRGNNGVASIDHLDDTIAFFEKHNLDLDNRTIQAAIKAKKQGKKDREIDIEAQNAIDYDYYQGGWGDFYPDDDADDIAGEYRRVREEEQLILQEIEIARAHVAAIETLEEALTDESLSAEFFHELKPEFRTNERLARLAIGKDSHNITYVDSTLPFYKELVIQALNKNINVFPYLSDDIKLDLDVLKLYDERKYFNIDDELPFSKTSSNAIQGYYDSKKDKVVIIASNTPIDEASVVAIHEIAHRGLIRMAKELGGSKELNKILLNSEKELMKALPELLKRTGHKTKEALLLDYGFENNEEGKIKLLSELVARWAEKFVNQSQPSWWKEFISSIKKWIEQFTNNILSEQEVNEFIAGVVKYGSQQELGLAPLEIKKCK